MGQSAGAGSSSNNSASQQTPVPPAMQGPQFGTTLTPPSLQPPVGAGGGAFGGILPRGVIQPYPLEQQPQPQPIQPYQPQIQQPQPRTFYPRQNNSCPQPQVGNPVMFAEGGSTSDTGARAVYQPQYTNYGLGSTPQAQGYLRSVLGAQSYGRSVPTFTRPQAPQQTYTRPVYSGVQSGIQSKVDPNLAIINRAFAPQPYQYDSDGNRHEPAPALMDQSQRDAILADPSKYLEYAQYVKGGGDPSQFAYKPPQISMMSQTQLDALRKKQTAELSRLLPPAYVSDQGGS